MVIIDGDTFYTVQDLASITGYSIRTIYNLSCNNFISKPIRGIDSSAYPSRGLYKENVISELAEYKALKLRGLTKAQILDTLKLLRTTDERVQILEA